MQGRRGRGCWGGESGLDLKRVWWTAPRHFSGWRGRGKYKIGERDILPVKRRRAFKGLGDLDTTGSSYSTMATLAGWTPHKGTADVSRHDFLGTETLFNYHGLGQAISNNSISSLPEFQGKNTNSLTAQAYRICNHPPPPFPSILPLRSYPCGKRPCATVSFMLTCLLPPRAT